jgi:hypothetical protein
MSVLVVVEVPGGSAALDEALKEAWDLTGTPPAGNRFRLAGPMDGGWRVVSLWDSAEQFEQFLLERLHLTLDETGDEEPSVTVWEIETVETFS